MFATVQFKVFYLPPTNNRKIKIHRPTILPFVLYGHETCLSH